MTEAVDHKARSDAISAMLRMDGHEKQCTERWEQSRLAHTDLKNSVASLKESLVSGFRWVVGLVLAGMGSVILMLINMQTGLHHP